MSGGHSPRRIERRPRQGRMVMRLVASLVLVLVLSVMMSLYQPRWGLRLAMAVAPGAVFFADTTEPIVAITIDDGPDPRSTPAILDVLHRHQAQATFFLIGDRLDGNEALVQRMLREGHELGNHLTRDEMTLRLSPAAFEQTLLETDQMLRQIIAAQFPSGDSTAPPPWPRWLRPGMGFYNQRMVAIAQKHGYQSVLGSIFPYDTHLPSARFAAWFILHNLRPGDIIVLHDSGRKGQNARWGERTALVLQTILPELQRRGYRSVTLSDLFADQQ